MRFKIRCLISNSLAMLILLTMLTIPSLAATGDYNGGGDGNTGGEEGSSYSWNQNKEGYRISIVDDFGKLQATPVDILYSTKPTGSTRSGLPASHNPLSQIDTVPI